MQSCLGIPSLELIPSLFAHTFILSLVSPRTRVMVLVVFGFLRSVIPLMLLFSIIYFPLFNFLFLSLTAL